MNKRVYFFLFSILLGIVTLVSIDILNIEVTYSSLENISNIVNNEISIKGGVTNSIRQYIKKEINGEIYCNMDDCMHIKSGDTYVYVVEKNIRPILMPYKSISLKVSKSVIIK